jgi:hypothetical protein
VDALLREPRAEVLVEAYSRDRVVDGIRELLAMWRERIRSDGGSALPPPHELMAELAARLEVDSRITAYVFSRGPVAG